MSENVAGLALALGIMVGWPVMLLFALVQSAKHDMPFFLNNDYVIGFVFLGPPVGIAIGSIYFLEGTGRFIPAIVLLALGGLAAYEWLKPSREHDTTRAVAAPPTRTVQRSTTKGKTSRLGLVGLALLGLGMIAGGILGVILSINEFRDRNASKEWPTTLGQVSMLDVYSTSGMQTCPEITYVYFVEGVEFSGHRFNFEGGNCFNSERRAREWMAPYSAATPITVYYDPGEPEVSTLKPGGRIGSSVGIFFGGLAMFLVGTFLFLAGLSGPRKDPG